MWFSPLVGRLMKRPKRPTANPQSSPDLLTPILDATDGLVVVLDPEGRIVEFNRACEAATGFGADEVRGRIVWESLIPAEQIEGVMGVFSRLRAVEFPIRFENHWTTKEGGRRLISWSNTAVVDDAGEVRYVIGTGVDLTELKRVEAERRETEHYYRALVETMTDGLVVDDLDGVITYVNNTICEMLGYSRDELVGRLLTDFVDEKSARVLDGRIVNRSTETSTEPYDLTIQQRDGSALEVRVAPQRLVGADGQTTGTFAVMTDLTAIKRLQREQSLLVTAIEQTADSVVITDTEGTIKYVNPAFEQTTGYSGEEAIGANPRILKSGQQDNAVYRNLWETISSGRVWSGLFTNLRKDGTLFDEEATISPVFGEQDEVIAYVAVKRNVTLENELTRQLDRAHKFEALGELAGGIAHDFNNLFTAIAGSAELLRLRLPESSGIDDELTTIRETVARGAALTNRLLSVAQRQTLKLVVFDLNKAVLDELEIVRRVLPETMRIDFTPVSGRLAIRGDRGQLAQVLLNLCANARDAMPDGGVITVSTTEITADAMLLAANPDAREGRYAGLSVGDAGAGMDIDTANRAFDPFFARKGDPDDSGLGLATVYGIVRQHNGMIKLESIPGAGSRFDLFFPLTSEPLDEEESIPEHAVVGGGETILMVEDEAGVRQVQVRMLEALGYTVLQAENGRAALDILDRERDAIDMVLSDVTMPEMGGQELLDLARSRYPDLIFVFTSGYTGTDFIDRLNRGESVHFIPKPFSMAKLAAIIREALAG